MQAYMEGETVHMKLEGKMVDLLTKLDPRIYCKHVTKKIEDGPLRVAQKIPIRYAPGRASILAKSDIVPIGVGI